MSRYNIYLNIHKALRGLMLDTLLKVGRTDVADDCERAQAIASARSMLDMFASHLRHENTFVHPALERATAGSSGKTASDHVGHESHIAALRAQIDTFEYCDHAARPAVARHLYLELSRFAAENLEHMLFEETSNQAVLTAAYTDAELIALEQRIVASLSPEESAFGMRWMIGHMNADERARMLGEMKRHAPAPVFERVLGLAHEVLSQRDFYKLENALAA